MSTAQSGTDLIPVTEANFARAETHLYFGNSLKAGGAGRFHHIREVMSIDHQTVIRANRDTLYSSGVFDLDAGPVTITLPDTSGRFMSMIAIDEDEYALETVYAPGRFTYTKEKVGRATSCSGSARSSIQTIPRTLSAYMRFKTACKPTSHVPARSSSRTGIR